MRWLAQRAGRVCVGALLVLGLPAPAAGPAATAQLHGVVTWVSDGDTLWVRPARGERPLKVRLQHIDAPEICQPGGPAARRALERLVLGQPVRVVGSLHDDYGRRLARVLRGRRDVGEQLVREGHAWNSRFRGRHGPYVAAEAQARAERRGLFADAQAELPREFRLRHGACRP